MIYIHVKIESRWNSLSEVVYFTDLVSLDYLMWFRYSFFKLPIAALLAYCPGDNVERTQNKQVSVDD